jgi:hypothetical protein
MAALCILPAYAAQCYGDIGFESLTCNLILGVAIGVAAKAGAWAAARPAETLARAGRGRLVPARVALPREEPLPVDTSWPRAAAWK